MEENNSEASLPIRVVKLSTGEEIISFIEEFENEIVLHNPAKIVTYTTATSEGAVIECIRLTSYLGNIDVKTMSILKQYVLYIANPSEEINKMYDSFINFMKGINDKMITGTIDDAESAEDAAWNLFSDPEFVDFLQEIYEEHLSDLEDVEETDEIDEELDAKWEKEVEKSKKRKKKYKKEELKLPYNPDMEASDPQSWSDNPEDYIK
jgi:hypothetical protein